MKSIHVFFLAAATTTVTACSKPEPCEDVTCNEWGCNEGVCVCDDQYCGCEVPLTGPECNSHRYSDGSGHYYGYYEMWADDTTKIAAGDTLCFWQMAPWHHDMIFYNTLIFGMPEDIGAKTYYSIKWTNNERFEVLSENAGNVKDVAPSDSVGYGRYNHDDRRLFVSATMNGGEIRFSGIRTYE